MRTGKYSFTKKHWAGYIDRLLHGRRSVTAALQGLQGSRPPIFDLQGSSCVDDPPIFWQVFYFFPSAELLTTASIDLAAIDHDRTPLTAYGASILASLALDLRPPTFQWCWRPCSGGSARHSVAMLMQEAEHRLVFVCLTYFFYFLSFTYTSLSAVTWRQSGRFQIHVVNARRRDIFIHLFIITDKGPEGH